MTNGKNIKMMAAVAIVCGMLFSPGMSSAMVAAPAAGKSVTAYAREIKGNTLILEDGQYDLTGVEVVNRQPGVSARGKRVEMLFIEDKLKKVIIH